MRRVVEVFALVCLVACPAAAQNLVRGGSFDSASDMDFWQLAGPNDGWDPQDAFADPGSGSARLLHTFAAVSGRLLRQCVPVTAGETYHYGAHARLDVAAVAVGDVRIVLGWWSTTDCTQGSLGPAFPTLKGANAGVWDPLRGTALSPQGAVAASIDIAVWKLEGAAEDLIGARFDEVFVERLACEVDADCDDGVFCNGYERCRDLLCTTGLTCADDDPGLECVEADEACVLRFNVDLQGDANHAGFFSQTDPVDHSEAGVLWNHFEVQALNSGTSDFTVDPSMALLSTGPTPVMALFSVDGDLVGWSGAAGVDSLTGDYWLLLNGFGVDSSVIDWEITLPADGLYDLTFSANSDGDPGRWTDHEVAGAGAAVRQTNADPPVTLRTASVSQTLSGRATGRSGGEGNWAALEIESVPLRTFLIDFQGDENHNGIFDQNDPVPFSSDTEVWNAFQVAALSSLQATNFDSNPQQSLLDRRGGSSGVVFQILGDTVGWSGDAGADSLTGDYLILATAWMVDASVLDWEISGLEPKVRYRLTFRTHDDGGTQRAVTFDVAPHSVTVRNADLEASLDVQSDTSGSIAGRATNAGSFEGNWSALEIRALPEPSVAALSLAALVTLLGLRRAAGRSGTSPRARVSAAAPPRGSASS